MEERKFRDTTLDALRDALEEFADEVRYLSSRHCA
jgi:hypothetical protein